MLQETRPGLWENLNSELEEAYEQLHRAERLDLPEMVDQIKAEIERLLGYTTTHTHAEEIEAAERWLEYEAQIDAAESIGDDGTSAYLHMNRWVEFDERGFAFDGCMTRREEQLERWNDLHEADAQMARYGEIDLPQWFYDQWEAGPSEDF